MYTHYFGFKERPFKLVPNPDYLYLSHSHEEALAHLMYAVTEGDGFLTITGEVGTGKTTLCRSFIDKLDHQTVVAYIFNPKLDAVQLLKAINDEFEIQSDYDNTKDLIDALNRFLIEKRQEGKQVVLLIDEAQNLTVNVLEQLRLLSNLETTREKLLQIILVGQPELIELLDSHELRQLAQRITLRRHLMPLNEREVKEYIAHRLNLASQKSQVKFTNNAVRTVNGFSNGIPRLINILCDRALLTAYGLNRKKITAAIVKSAIRELNVSGSIMVPTFFSTYRLPLLLSFLLLSLILLGIFHPNDIFNLRPLMSSTKTVSINMPLKAKPISKAPAPPSLPPENSDVLAETVSPPIDIAPSLQLENHSESPKNTENPMLNALSKKEPVETALPDPETAPSAPPLASTKPVTRPLNFKDYIESIDIAASRETAIQVILDLWALPHTLNMEPDQILDDNKFFLLAAQQNGLSVSTIKDNLALAKRLNVPFILEIYWPEKLTQVYLAVHKIDPAPNDKLYLKASPEDNGIFIDEGELSSFLGENAFVFWKNFYGYTGVIPTSTSENSIITLKLHIREMGFPEMDITPYYDKNTRDIVRTFQKKYHIAEDGLVGPITKVVLYNETPSLPIPHLLN